MLLTPNAQGVFPIAPTAFHPDGRIDTASMDRLTDFYVACGATGVTVLGQMGHSLDQSLLDAVVQAAGVVLVVHAAWADVDHRRRHARTIVDHRRDRRKAHLGFACHCHLWHHGCADDVGALALQGADFGRCFKSRPFDTGEHASVENPVGHAGGGFEQRQSYLWAEGLSHVYADPALGIVKQ